MIMKDIVPFIQYSGVQKIDRSVVEEEKLTGTLFRSGQKDRKNITTLSSTLNKHSYIK